MTKIQNAETAMVTVHAPAGTPAGTRGTIFIYSIEPQPGLNTVDPIIVEAY